MHAASIACARLLLKATEPRAFRLEPAAEVHRGNRGPGEGRARRAQQRPDGGEDLRGRSGARRAAALRSGAAERWWGSCTASHELLGVPSRPPSVRAAAALLLVGVVLAHRGLAELQEVRGDDELGGRAPGRRRWGQPEQDLADPAHGGWVPGMPAHAHAPVIQREEIVKRPK